MELENFFIFFIWCPVILVVGGIICAIFINDIGASKGSHTGYVTAVEDNQNLFFDATLVYFKTDAQSSQEELKYKMSHYWACMDGCSNMQEIIYNVTHFDVNNITMKNLHDVCASRCATQYMTQLLEVARTGLMA